MLRMIGKWNLEDLDMDVDTFEEKGFEMIDMEEQESKTMLMEDSQ